MACLAGNSGVMKAAWDGLASYCSNFGWLPDWGYKEGAWDKRVTLKKGGPSLCGCAHGFHWTNGPNGPLVYHLPYQLA